MEDTIKRLRRRRHYVGKIPKRKGPWSRFGDNAAIRHLRFGRLRENIYVIFLWIKSPGK